MKIVVAIDGEDSAKSALDEIAAQKYSSETQIHLVHVIVPGFADVSTPGIPDTVAIERAEEKGVLEQMAKDLKQGDRLHAMQGAALIGSIDQDPPAEAFNLVVSDNHDYFVGDSLVLAHDNVTPVESGALVPGLAVAVQKP